MFLKFRIDLGLKDTHTHTKNTVGVKTKLWLQPQNVKVHAVLTWCYMVFSKDYAVEDM